MKKVIVFLVMLLSVTAGFAQENPGAAQERGRLKGEVSIGTGVPLNLVGASRSGMILSVGGELRWLFPNSPWDMGIGSRVGAFKRVYDSGLAATSGSPLYVSSQHYLSLDYNVWVNPSLKLFMGVEAGISVAYDMTEYNRGSNTRFPGVSVDPNLFYTPKRLSPYIGPRIGFEAWDHLRGTLSVGFMDKGDSQVNFRLGYAF